MAHEIPVKVSSKGYVNPSNIVAVILDDSLRPVVMLSNGLSLKSDLLFSQIYENWIGALNGKEASELET